MINVCDEVDCFLHTENEWRSRVIDSYEVTIKELNGNLLNIKELKLLFDKFINLYEGENIPIHCMNCIYRKPRDMKAEFLAYIAKIQLLK